MPLAEFHIYGEGPDRCSLEALVDLSGSAPVDLRDRARNVLHGVGP